MDKYMISYVLLISGGILLLVVIFNMVIKYVKYRGVISEEVSDTVKIGSSVVIRYDGEDDTEEYKIVGSTESDPFENKISNESPIAKALLGKKKGSKVTVESPNGKYDIELVDIK